MLKFILTILGTLLGAGAIAVSTNVVHSIIYYGLYTTLIIAVPLFFCFLGKGIDALFTWSVFNSTYFGIMILVLFIATITCYFYIDNSEELSKIIDNIATNGENNIKFPGNGKIPQIEIGDTSSTGLTR